MALDRKKILKNFIIPLISGLIILMIYYYFINGFLPVQKGTLNLFESIIGIGIGIGLAFGSFYLSFGRF